MKRKLYQFPKNYFKNIFWEENQDNLYYGHYNIFKTYTKSILPFKINGEIQHGWSPHSGITSLDLESTNNNLKLRRYYVFNESNKKCLKGGYENVITIGAPFLYLNSKKISCNNQIAKSLILYPTHSHEWFDFTDPAYTYKKYIDEIKKIMSFLPK